VKILLDECLPRDLRKYLVGHDCATVPEAGLAGRANGELLTLAERSGWQILITMDRGMPYQQNLAGRAISLAVIRAPSNRLPDLLPHVPKILAALPTLQPGKVMQIA
jgi:predicted nuclease of predicted toxin-antitoxin system